MKKSFNPLNRGNLNQIAGNEVTVGGLIGEFQSPKSGKFESNIEQSKLLKEDCIASFNPLNRGNLNQIISQKEIKFDPNSFNPLNRGNLNQILKSKAMGLNSFQSFNPLNRGNLNQIGRRICYRLKRPREVSIP